MPRKTPSLALLALFVLAPAACAAEPASQPAQRKQYDAPPRLAIDPAKAYTATIVTNRGKIVIDLFAREAPLTVNNFVFLARERFYDGIVFHRVIEDFMVQGGDPTGTGTGGPGYKFQDEVEPATNPHTFKAGTLAMANAGPATNGSQFFVTHKATPWLQGKHTVFGQVRDKAGQDVVNAIQKGDTITTITIDEAAAK